MIRYNRNKMSLAVSTSAQYAEHNSQLIPPAHRHTCLCVNPLYPYRPFAEIMSLAITVRGQDTSQTGLTTVSICTFLYVQMQTRDDKKIVINNYYNTFCYYHFYYIRYHLYAQYLQFYT
jgi:hypothetical protein